MRLGGIFPTRLDKKLLYMLMLMTSAYKLGHCLAGKGNSMHADYIYGLMVQSAGKEHNHRSYCRMELFHLKYLLLHSP